MTTINNPPPGTGQFIPSTTIRKPNQIGLIILVLVAIVAMICCCCLPTITGMISSTPTAPLIPSLAPSYTPLPGQSFAMTETALTQAAPSAIPESSQLTISLSQFMEQYDNGTDLQREQYPEQSKDKWISWSGEVSNVSDDGIIMVKIPNTLASYVDIKGISPDVAAKISKNETIGFTGRITKMIDFLGVRITIEDAQLLEVLPTEVAITSTPADTEEAIFETETPQPKTTTRPTSTITRTATRAATATSAPVVVAPTKVPATNSACIAAYPDFCITRPRLTCDQLGVTDFTVLPPDPLGYDRDNDGLGCES